MLSVPQSSPQHVNYRYVRITPTRKRLRRLGPSGQLCVGIRRQDNCSQFRVSGYPLLHLNVLCISIRVSDAELLPILEQLIPSILPSYAIDYFEGPRHVNSVTWEARNILSERVLLLGATHRNSATVTAQYSNDPSPQI